MKAVLVVEDLEAVRLSLEGILRDSCGYREVLGAGDLDEARALVARHDFELAIIDLGLPSGSGLALIDELTAREPPIPCIVSTVYGDDEHVFPALAHGAEGYLLKDLPADEWARYVRRWQEGVPALSPSIARRILGHFRASHERTSEEPALTTRETEVLRCIGRGLRVPEVAELLGIAESTVSGYVKAIYRKLSVSSRAEAALEAARRGLV